VNPLRPACLLALVLLAPAPAECRWSRWARLLAGGRASKKAPAAPKVLLALPLGVKPGATTRLTLRGHKLDSATGVRCLPKGAARVVKKGKVGVPPQQDVDRVGDTTLELDLAVPADVLGGSLSLVVQSPDGESAPHAILLDRAPVLAEKEPNDSFKRAQPLKVGQVVQGSIGRPLDVDVYSFEGKAGQKVVVEVHAAHLGSALDSLLTLYDDLPDSADSRLEVTLPRAGAYFAFQDAHDQGGPAHVYRLSVR
jgi:hypothetical protein